MYSLPYQNDPLTMRQLCKKPVFIANTALLMLGLLVLLACFNGGFWPRFCEEHHWAFFTNMGIFPALVIIDMSSWISWIIFESYNWVHHVFLYFLTGILLILISVLFMIDFFEECEFWPVNDELWYDEDVENRIFELACQFLMVIDAIGYVILAIFYCIFREEMTQ